MVSSSRTIGRRTAILSTLGLLTSVVVGTASLSVAWAMPDPSAGRSSSPPFSASRALSQPVALAAYNGALFVVNHQPRPVTELNASAGTWLRTISAAEGRFSSPVAIAGLGYNLFVANGTGSVSEVDARTGSL